MSSSEIRDIGNKRYESENPFPSDSGRIFVFGQISLLVLAFFQGELLARILHT
jgi:hypothetical protein